MTETHETLSIDWKPVRYCARCGAKMKSQKVDVGFHTETGEPMYNIVYTCRNRRWFGDGHSKFKTDQNGSSYAFEI